MKKMYLKKCATLYTYLLAGLFACSISTAADITPAFDEDVEKYAREFSNPNLKALDETLVQLSWAGITDPRVYDPLIQKVSNEPKLSDSIANKYFEAMSMSGNPDVYAKLEQLSQNKQVKSGVRSKAHSALKHSAKYVQIAQTMSVGLQDAKTNDELWAIRHRNGLAVADTTRLRLAARDLYLHGYEKESLDVAAQTLRDNTDKILKDRLQIDAMAFLCKALGTSRKREYKETLIFVADNAKTKKLMEYAERSTQYFDNSFKANNPNFRKSSSNKH
jgi:hypothetical protein